MTVARKWNWLLWTGFCLALISFISYFTVFARFPITRDIPWVNYLLFVIAVALLVAGMRRASRKVIASIVAALGAAVFVFFALIVVVGSKILPASHGAPRVGQKAPDFALLDSNGHLVSLSSILASSPRGAVLIFYRGYW
ncbi:MAG: hypothetical protein ACXVIJ_11870 [Thermoanaerobaculia bacterium]